jgi:LmbE family N-acetylglucosaminyl deacetylase
MAKITLDAHGKRILGLFAHPDDETFCAGGTLAKYVDAGAEAMVVSFTQGEAGQIRDAGKATRRILGKVRAQELINACEQLGVQQAVCLDYGDGRLHTLDLTILVEKIVEIIRSFKPDIIVTFGADGAYGHPDHIAVSIATTDALPLANDPTAFPAQLEAGLTPHQPSRLYHSHFPRSRLLMMEELVSWLVNQEDRFRGNTDFVHALMLFAEESTTLRFADDHMYVQWVPAGFYIIEQGEMASSLYLILSGKVNAIREHEDGSLTIKEQLGPGVFVGEAGLANAAPRNAHIVAVTNVTCLVFSPNSPTGFTGRGEDAELVETAVTTNRKSENSRATTIIDVSAFLEQKIHALAQHRTQYPIAPDMFPTVMLQKMLGSEYFVRVHPPVEIGATL